MITITVPCTALGGDTGPPGEVAGFGILDHADTRDLVAAAARNPATRWCVTLLSPDGTAAAHGCAAGSRRWPPESVTPSGLLDFEVTSKVSPAADLVLAPSTGDGDGLARATVVLIERCQPSATAGWLPGHDASVAAAQTALVTRHPTVRSLTAVEHRVVALVPSDYENLALCEIDHCGAQRPARVSRSVRPGRR
jgi:hypothetical protein